MASHRRSCRCRCRSHPAADSRRSTFSNASRLLCAKRSWIRKTLGELDSTYARSTSAHLASQELSAVQDGAQGLEEAHALPTAADPCHPPQAFLVQRPVQRQGSFSHLPPEGRGAHRRSQIETQVQYPLSGLDLTSFMPPPLFDQKAPALKSPPKGHVYDLYGVTNHFGNLSSGH